MITPNKITKLSAKSKFKNCEKDLCVADFWAWAYSDLLQNTTRGVLAEYILSFLLDTADEVRNPWDAYDLKLKNGKTIEVKTTSKLQAWAQKKLSEPAIALRPTRFWDPLTGEMKGEVSFNADYYIFCVFLAEDHSKANPLDLEQWQFYVFTKKEIEKLMANRKSITIRMLNSLGHQPVSANELPGTLASKR